MTSLWKLFDRSSKANKQTNRNRNKTPAAKWFLNLQWGHGWSTLRKRSMCLRIQQCYF